MLGFLDWAIIVLYMAGMIVVGVAASRRQTGAESYFLGGRSMPAWAVTLSVLATSLSGATFIGAPQISYGGDLTYLILNLGGVIGALIVAFWFIPTLYRAGTVTIYGYLGKRFGPGAKIAASAMFLLGRLLASGARLYIAAIAFSLILYGDIEAGHLILAIVVLGVIGTLYTAMGGIRAVIWTDVIQIAVMVFAAGLSIYLLLDAIPLSAGEIVAALRDFEGKDKLRVVDTSLSPAASFTIWTGVIANTFVYTAAYGVDHDMTQRMLTTRSAGKGSASMIASTLLSIPVVMMFLVIGLLLSIYYGRPDLMGAAAPLDALDDTRQVFPQFLLNHLPAGIKGLAMAGLFAAAMSSLDSAINAMASSAVTDLWEPWAAWRRRRGGRDKSEPASERGQLHAPRVGVVAMGAGLVGFAVLAVLAQQADGRTLIDFALGVMAFANGPLLGVFGAALFTRRGNVGSVLAALGAGFLCVLLIQPYALQAWLDFELAWPWWTMIAATVSFAVCIAGKPDAAAGDASA